MHVRRVRMLTTGLESWTVLDPSGAVEPVERWLAYLTSIEKSPNTVKAYSHDLKDWFTYLTGSKLDWRQVKLEDLGDFVAWLRLPPEVRSGEVLALPTVPEHCGDSSVARKLSALSSFYEFHARHGTDLGELLITWRPRAGARNGWKAFLHHVAKHQPQRHRTITIKPPKRIPQVLTLPQVQTILDACPRLRDRLLFAILFDAGLRIGEALGLRHEDLEVAERALTVIRRDNDNRARAKSRDPRTVPVSAGLLRLYADYLDREYGALDSDYVFVNLWGDPYGHPLTYATAYDLVKRIRRRTGIRYTPHLFRHTFATELLRRGTPIETVAELLGHTVFHTTELYGHLTVEDARRQLEAAGWLAGREVRL
jgi:integrase/recombinase XerD